MGQGGTESLAKAQRRKGDWRLELGTMDDEPIEVIQFEKTIDIHDGSDCADTACTASIIHEDTIQY